MELMWKREVRSQKSEIRTWEEERQKSNRYGCWWRVRCAFKKGLITCFKLLSSYKAGRNSVW